ncbi:Hypothetical protein R9X50_00539200 [Acrodontium crateriforme]|uniref:Uncharacterized protein n=1 Tax=Acrodontium crateriforme TaxID=150365 RepID=A0AAQ3M7Q8_9PEZI|nr:Hypothetical protein R9X50_00539200 [Acrodontium crateriforme]
MADSSTTHSSMAGARLDPNLSSDSQGISSSAGAVDTDRVHQEGIDHIKANSGLGSTSSTTGTTSLDSGLPSSNPADSTLSSGAGGVSGSAYVSSPNAATSSNPTTATSAERDTLPSSTTTGLYGDSTTSSDQGYLGAAGAAITGAVGSAATATGLYNNNSTTTTGATSASTADRAGPADDLSSIAQNVDSSSSQKYSGDALSSNNAETSFSDNTTRTHDTTRFDSSAEGYDPHSTDSGEAGASKADIGDEDKPLKAADGSKDEGGAVRENKSAIPTAGGQRLGERHWGESQIVPDLPPKQEEVDTRGVSSSEGQPTNQVRENTKQNIGTATTGPAGQDLSSTSNQTTDSGEGKEKLVDKIKDKLHIGSKN